MEDPEEKLAEDDRRGSAEQDTNQKVKPLKSLPVKWSNQDVNLVLYEDSLTIENHSDCKRDKRKNMKGLDCQWCDIISAQKTDTESKTLTIHYIEQQKNKALRNKTITLTCTTDNHDSIFCAIQEQCQKVPNRPKKLFVIINPIGGSQKGVQLYEKKIAPIFKLASIETTVFVSERAKHAIEIGENTDFTGYDGIICVSGDGLYQELLEGYIRQLQRASGVDVNDSKAQLVKPEIPFCLMPAGSGNGTVGYTNDGVIDLETSALRVLRGEVHHMNILTVHEPGKLVGVCGLAFGIGLITDLLLHADQRRWMKRARYAYSIPAVLFKKRRFYDAIVEYILDDEEGTAKDGIAQPTKEWNKTDAGEREYVGTVFTVSRMVNLGHKTIVSPFNKSGTIVIDTGCSNWGFVKGARTMIGQHPAANIPNLAIKDNALSLRVKILPKKAVQKECNGETNTKDCAVEGKKKTSEKEETCQDSVPKGDKKDSREVCEKEAAESGAASETVKDEGGGDESSKPEDLKQASSSESKSAERSNRKERAADRALARNQELECHIYLDGETRRVDGTEFECRLHAGFVPMFGCLAIELR